MIITVSNDVEHLSNDVFKAISGLLESPEQELCAFIQSFCDYFVHYDNAGVL